jgi:hypothetical protein
MQDENESRLPKTIGAQVVLAACLVFFLIASAIGWEHSILDGHPWREPQTAITAYYMIGKLPQLAYETPLFGPPWSVPFEFPVYQWTVAGLVTLLHTPLDQTGRAVNMVFFLATLLPVNYLLGALQMCRSHRCMVLALVLLSPFYIFWSRTFMIESTALFLSATYAALMVAGDRTLSIARLVAAMGFGSLAAMVKLTTLVPFLAVGPLFGLMPRKGGRRLPWVARFGMLLVPLAAGVWWTQYADRIKGQNPQTRPLQTAAMAQWNFGTLAQRSLPEAWGTVVAFWGQVVGSLTVLAICALIVLFLVRRRLQFCACLGLALSAPILFFNLYVEHEYYTYAIGIFLIAAAGIVVVALMEGGGASRWLGGALWVLIAAASLARYGESFYPRLTVGSEEAPEAGAVAAAVQAVTRPDDVLVTVGLEWSPLIPFYSQRRALMILPEFTHDFLQNPATWVERLRPYRAGVLVIGLSPNGRFDVGTLESALKALRLDPRGQRVAYWYLVFHRLER